MKVLPSVIPLNPFARLGLRTPPRHPGQAPDPFVRFAAQPPGEPEPLPSFSLSLPQKLQLGLQSSKLEAALEAVERHTRSSADVSFIDRSRRCDVDRFDDMMLPNVPQYPIAVAAILRAGGVVVNLNPLATPREIEHQLKDSGARVIVLLEHYAGVLQEVADAVLAPSALDAERQQALVYRFASLTVPGDTRPAFRILFRDGRRLGANALALPDGTLVVTDQLVRLADDDAQILAVLAHELGHVERRHSLRMLIQTSVVGLVMAWYIGDVSGLAAGLPTLLLQAGYSREHEREADRYAADLLRLNGLSPRLLADMLEKLEAAQGGDGATMSGLGYLSSHPSNRERVRYLRNGS